MKKKPLWLFVSFAKDWVTKNRVKNEEHGKQVKTPIKRQCFKFTHTTKMSTTTCWTNCENDKSNWDIKKYAGDENVDDII